MASYVAAAGWGGYEPPGWPCVSSVSRFVGVPVSTRSRPSRQAGRRAATVRAVLAEPWSRPAQGLENGRSRGGARLEFSVGAEVGLLEEVELRYSFLEFIMERARSGDAQGVEEAMSEMGIAGLHPGPRAYHGLVVAYALNGDSDGALQALRREFGSGERPLPETFTTLARLFGSKGHAKRGEEILAAMEKMDQDPRLAWLALVEELFNAGQLEEANNIFFKGATGGLKSTTHLDDILVHENCRIGQHGNAVNIMKLMEFRGRRATTFHFNCLLMAQANADVPDIAAMTFENMQYGHEGMKPDTESYNWLIQAHTRHKYGDRCKEVIDVLGVMVEDHTRVMPNLRTYTLLVECFTKWNQVNEAVRHFRALCQHPGGTAALYNDGKNDDCLSLYLRAICLEGRAVEILQALEAMERDNQSLPPRAMFVNRKGRTLVSSWIEPLQQEPDLGYEVDYVARYIAEGGLTGTRNRWRSSPNQQGRLVDPDSEGFAYSKPMEVSFRQHCSHMRKKYNMKLLRKLKLEGAAALGPGATEDDLIRVLDKLKKETFGESFAQSRKPKAASKMLVSELKQELEAQDLPTDGTRPVLYQRVQKARRINRARGRPLWVPPAEYEHVEVDEELDKFMSQLSLKDENTEYWRKKFSILGSSDGTHSTEQRDVDVDVAAIQEDEENDEAEDEEDEEIEEEVEDVDLVEDGGEEDEPDDAPEMLAVQLFKNTADLPEEKLKRELGRRDGDWLDLTLEEKFAKLKADRVFDVSELYTIADVWGWTWERHLLDSAPERWTQEREVQLGMQILQKVLDLGGVPTVSDCAMLVRAAIKTPCPEAIVSLLQQSHKLKYVYGSKLYEEAVTLCISLGERDAAVAIVADMEDAGIVASADLLGKILEVRLDDV